MTLATLVAEFREEDSQAIVILDILVSYKVHRWRRLTEKYQYAL